MANGHRSGRRRAAASAAGKIAKEAIQTFLEEAELIIDFDPATSRCTILLQGRNVAGEFEPVSISNTIPLFDLLCDSITSGPGEAAEIFGLHHLKQIRQCLRTTLDQVETAIVDTTEPHDNDR